MPQPGGGNVDDDTPVGCNFTDESSCVASVANSTCTKDSNGCYVFSGCKDGYELANGACVLKVVCEYTDIAACETANANMVCSVTDDGCAEPSACAVDYVDFSNCWNNQLDKIVRDTTYCESAGYIHNSGDCNNYLACPSDINKIRCLD